MQRGTCASWTGLAPAGATRRAASAPTCTAGLASALQTALPPPAGCAAQTCSRRMYSAQQPDPQFPSNSEGSNIALPIFFRKSEIMTDFLT